MPANTQANNILIANPIVPTQIPPAPNNFISPKPIGGHVLSFCRRSNTKPTTKPKQYPNAPPITESAVVTGQLKNVVINKPANINGKRYVSGMIRRFKSVVDMRYAQKPAPIKIKQKNMYEIMFFSLAFRFVFVIQLYQI